MDLGDRGKSLLGAQREIVKEYEELLRQISEDDSINENIKLRSELDKLKEELKQYEKKTQKLAKENLSITIALKEQMYNERNNILRISLKKIEIYFKSEEKAGVNKLLYLENSARDRIRGINKALTEELGDYKDELGQAIYALEKDLEEKVKIQREKIGESYQKSLEEIKLEYDNEQKEISDEQLAKKQKHNNVEVNIGLNWINKIGVILLLFGVATAMKYTYSAWFNDYMKAISGFLLGGAMLGAGEWFNKKERNLFALGLCGGGIGVLYLAVFSSYFFFNILNLPVSMIISILITLGALTLSQRYNSRTIAGISLFGGYLPFFSYGLMMGLEGTEIYVAMGYLIILNLLMLMIALERRWIFINYLSFILNMPCLILLVYLSDSAIMAIIYGVLTFIMYLGITLAYPIRENIKLRIGDIILLGINTVINCLIMYALFEINGFNDYMGLLALVYAVGYFILSRIISGRYSQEKHVEALFSITALTFSILMVPFQFGVKWVAMGWLIEAILILVFAKKRHVDKIELGGWVILILCTLGFTIDDISMGWDIEYFALRYTLLTFGLVYVFSLYIPQYNKNKYINIFKYGVILNSWVYILRIFARGYNLYIADKMPLGYIDFYRIIIMAILTIIFAYTVVKIRIIRDKGVIAISTILLILSNITCLMLNFDGPSYGLTPTARWIGITVLLIYNVLVFFSVKDIVIGLIKKKGISIEYYPLVMAIYLLGVITSFITMQLSLQNANLIISIILVISAMICIIFGFKKNYLLIRRFGLGLSIFATGKLFIFDLANLAGYGRIIAYFSFGLVLIAISYIYQKLNTSLKKEDSSEKIS